jgi:hypothetical protein
MNGRGEAWMIGELTHRQQVVLAALAAEPGASFAPVQIQKLFFLLDENAEAQLGGKQFQFRPYDFGPFDQAVYAELEVLETLGLVQISRVGPAPGHRRYQLTTKGQELGEEILSSSLSGLQSYMQEVSRWVRRLSFAQLVGSIYKAYPWTRENSVFQG